MQERSVAVEVGCVGGMGAGREAEAPTSVVTMQQARQECDRSEAPLHASAGASKR